MYRRKPGNRPPHGDDADANLRCLIRRQDLWYALCVMGNPFEYGSAVFRGISEEKAK